MQQDIEKRILPPAEIDEPVSSPARPSNGLVNISMRREHVPAAIAIVLLTIVACAAINVAVAYYTALAVVSRPAQWAALTLPTTGPLPTVLPVPAAAVQPTALPATAATTSSTTTSVAPVASDGLPGIGTDVQVGDIRWKVLDTRDEGPQLKADPSRFAAEAKTSGKYIRVRFEIENQSTEQIRFDSVSLGDQRQQSYPSTSDIKVLTHITSGERCGGSTLNPNAIRTCEALFDVPANANGFRLLVDDLNPERGESAEIALGL